MDGPGASSPTRCRGRRYPINMATSGSTTVGAIDILGRRVGPSCSICFRAVRCFAGTSPTARLSSASINEMSDFKTRRRKKLDLVVARPGTTQTGKTHRSRPFEDLGVNLGVRLSPEQQRALADLPVAVEGPVGSVLIALEAKACMTEHGKARPRLYDELNSSHLTIHGASDQAIAVGFVMLNAASTFISPDRNKFDISRQPPTVNVHQQPQATLSVEAKVRELPRRTRPGEEGDTSARHHGRALSQRRLARYGGHRTPSSDAR